MKHIIKAAEMREFALKMRRARGKQPKTIGFVPTMGALHEGHMSLIEAAKRENNRVIVSIFVNPAQFAANEDLNEYPRNLKADIKKLKQAKAVTCLFTPGEAEMYPEGYASYVRVENEMTKVLCGASRPEHFKGVTTIVAKLLNIINPDRMYLGQKDLQQAVILKKMAKELNYQAEVKICPTVRGKDGLALSSRNGYLTPEQRNSAPALYKALKVAESMVELGERDAQSVIKEIRRKLKEENVEAEYVEAVDPGTMLKKEKISGKTAILAAVFVGKTRLIDNTIIDMDEWNAVKKENKEDAL
ncbi:MAG TPA: pantoate--beta-alanine ligase [bacterium]|nr:pantoate--beta-alanine ligase [bacterium]